MSAIKLTNSNPRSVERIAAPEAKQRIKLPLLIDVSSHRLSDLLAAHVPAAIATERDARRAFGGVLMRVLAHRLELDDALFTRLLAHHPRRNHAMGRLLDDLRLDESTGDVDKEREFAEFDMTCDNDFDGLG